MRGDGGHDAGVGAALGVHCGLLGSDSLALALRLLFSQMLKPVTGK